MNATEQDIIDFEEELESFAYSLPHAAHGIWPAEIDCMSVEARTEYGVQHTWSYEQVRRIARHFLVLGKDWLCIIRERSLKGGAK